jgi:uncharacterized membrane protein
MLFLIEIMLLIIIISLSVFFSIANTKRIFYPKISILQNLKEIFIGSPNFNYLMNYFIVETTYYY